jgi:hypothetical protein
MRLGPAQAARVDGSAAATSHTVKTDPCAWCSVMVRSPNLRSITLEQHKHQKWVLLSCSQCALMCPVCKTNRMENPGQSRYRLRTTFERNCSASNFFQPINFEIQPAHVTSSRVPILPGRDEESLPGPRRAKHHLGARTVISIRMVSLPTAHTNVSAPPDHILTSLLLAFRYLLAQAPIRS